MERLRPLLIDLFCGVGGFTKPALEVGYQCVGFDNERHVYGDERYPGQLVVQDVRTLHGSQFRRADLIVASPPCTEYSWMAMPWSRAKQVARALRGKDEFSDSYTGSRTIAELNELFDACFRIQREACEAAGRHIPMIVENVRGAQPWVGRARWNYGSYYLWGDVPALMPAAIKARKNPGFRFDGSGRSFQSESVKRHVDGVKGAGPKGGEHGMTRWTNPAEGFKSTGLNWSDRSRRGQDFTRVAGAQAGVKQSGLSGTRENGKGDRWFQDGAAQHGSKSPARKAASALIAKIPYDLARHIAVTFHPHREAA